MKKSADNLVTDAFLKDYLSDLQLACHDQGIV